MSTANLGPVLDYLAALKRHNKRDWFEAHRAEYEAARTTFESFVADLILSLSKIDRLGGVKPRECIRRIYRDIRFSPDKTPYKTHMSAEIAPGGTKARRLAYYVHVAPKNGSLVAGGLYQPESADLVRFRQALAGNPKRFKRVIENREFKKHFGVLDGDRLKTAPKGFARDHPDINLLRLTEIVAWEEFSDANARRPAFAGDVIASFAALKPFLDYLNEVTGKV